MFLKKFLAHGYNYLYLMWYVLCYASFLLRPYVLTLLLASAYILWNFYTPALYISEHHHHMYMSPYSESVLKIIKLFTFEREIFMYLCLPEQCLYQAQWTHSTWPMCYPWHSVMLPMETSPIRRPYLTLSIAKLRYNAKAILQTYGIFMYGDIDSIINCIL
jgi:hypothetical protein